MDDRLTMNTAFLAACKRLSVSPDDAFVATHAVALAHAGYIRLASLARAGDFTPPVVFHLAAPEFYLVSLVPLSLVPHAFVQAHLTRFHTETSEWLSLLAAAEERTSPTLTPTALALSEKRRGSRF